MAATGLSPEDAIVIEAEDEMRGIAAAAREARARSSARPASLLLAPANLAVALDE